MRERRHLPALPEPEGADDSRPSTPAAAGGERGTRTSLSELGAQVRAELALTQKVNAAAMEALRHELAQCRDALHAVHAERAELLTVVSQVKVLEQSLTRTQAQKRDALDICETLKRQLEAERQKSEELGSLCDQLETAVKLLTSQRDQQGEELRAFEEQVTLLLSIIGLLELKQQRG